MDVMGLRRKLKEMLQEHLDIVSAIHYRDGRKAALLTRQPLENSEQAFLV